MPVVNSCPKCGGPLPNDVALGGGCPRCMLELGFETTVGSRERPGPGIAAGRPTVIGRYRILRLIGEGGMGAVYEAEQDHPRRTVALKIIKSGMASAELLRRFEQESQALGRLQHSGIAQIYEAGTVDTGFGPQPYFAMELIRGQSPRAYSEAKHWNVRERLRMMVKICDAVHHAHQRGLIHRDLKPGNILVDETGQPKILDFGVVRVTDSDARATLQTDMGQLIGTLAYMSPEQALADPLDVDTRSDVYSLGVILYELLAGRLPYTVSKKVHEAIRSIREEDPARLSTSNRTFRGDIETIVAKALEKDRDRRYASAAEMAADIQRYLNDEPIVARRPSASYQLQKFARRNKTLVTGVAAVFVVLIVGVAVSTWYAARVTRALDRALRAEYRASENVRVGILAGVRETEQRRVAEEATAKAEEKTLIAQQALGAREDNLYFNSIALADREWTNSNIANSDRFLDDAPVALRNWEWGYLARRNHMEESVIAGNNASILAMNLSLDGKRLRTVAADNTVKDLDLETGKAISTLSSDGTISRLVFSADGRVLYSSVASGINSFSLSIGDQFIDLSTGKELFSSRNSTLNLPAALDHDGKRIVGTFPATQVSPVQFILRWWDTATGVEFPSLGEYSGPISHLTFSPDDSKLAFAQNGSVRILNLQTRQELLSFGDPQSTITALSFSPNGETVATGILNEGLRLWRIRDGKIIWTAASGNVRALAFSPNAYSIAIALDDQTIRLLDGETGREVARLKGHSGAIHALGFTATGNQLVSVGDDKLVHIWNVRRKTPPTTLNVGRIQDPVKVSADGTMLLTSTENGLKSWTTNSGLLKFEHAFAAGRIEMDFRNNDGRFVLVNKGAERNDLGGIDRGDLLVMDAHTGREIIALHPQGNKEFGDLLGSDFWISSDGGRAALVSSIRAPGESPLSHSVVEMWDIRTGKQLSIFRVDNAMRGRPSVRFSENGNLLALGIVMQNGSDLKRGVEIYDTTTGRRVHRLDVSDTGILEFSPDGKRLAVVGPGRVITIWDAQTGMKLVSSREAGRTGTDLISIAFNSDGSRMVSLSSDGEVWLWDTKSGKEMISLPESSGSYEVREINIVAEGIAEAYRLIPVEFRSGLSWKERSIAFSPNGQSITLTTVDPDSKCITVRVETWDGSPRSK